MWTACIYSDSYRVSLLYNVLICLNVTKLMKEQKSMDLSN